ncbi:MAG: glutamine-hydrolyzing carbamoyl-phosphate synthase small subunit [Crocinitomicaceae bacterium]|nr:glutamine-hydrolyzing carbamoyl-phosphate synthase small subunit [Crocinitomicaceae bacterium]
MRAQERTPAILLLQDGTVFHGYAAGSIGTTTGEIAFNTGMTGYQEIFTDPSYYGQIIVMATSHIGNYGIKNDEIESDSVKISGMVCKKFSDVASRYGGDGSLNEYFEKENLVGICELDTRKLVRHIRDKGAMNAIISSEELDIEILKSKLKTVPSMAGLELASKVSCTESFEIGTENQNKVALLDFGVKKNIIRSLVDRGCHLKVFPWNTKTSEIMAWNPDGIMLSNGPGDPSVMPEVIATVQEIVASEIPVFGICLGHQLLALSQGLVTKKMHNGHRGINHPIKNMITGKCEVTSQNHGFVVDVDSANEHDNIEVTHVHLNDNTLAGIKVKDKSAFSVQYHPEAGPGPNDAKYLFDNFLENIIKAKQIQTV